ncbi:unnamed protein product [Amoebophrya sp. A25]|nr:unnamed protein product [Amoebophrya sp. A25]|eukprot:GSA25T00016195001.1
MVRGTGGILSCGSICVGGLLLAFAALLLSQLRVGQFDVALVSQTQQSKSWSSNDCSSSCNEKKQKRYVDEMKDSIPFKEGFDGPSLASKTVSIKIGTLGQSYHRPGQSDYLLTFDPFDRFQNASLGGSVGGERLPYVVSDYMGMLTFSSNHDVPGCSTINQINWHFKVEHSLEAAAYWKSAPNSSALSPERRKKLLANDPLQNDGQHPYFSGCFHPKRFTKQKVKAIQLSKFLSQRRVKKIDKLHIDAQGNDWTVIKDVLENYALANLEEPIREIQMECQYYSRTIAPFYYASNDCDDIRQYMSFRLPKHKFSQTWNTGNGAAEYNVFFRSS